MWYVPDGPRPLVAVTALAVIMTGLGIAGAVTHERTIEGTPVSECTAEGKSTRDCAYDAGLELIGDIVDINRIRASVNPVQTPEANLSNFRVAYCAVAAGRDMDLVLLGQGVSFRDIARSDYAQHTAEGRFPAAAGNFDEEIVDACP